MTRHSDLAKGHLNASNARSKSRELWQKLAQDLNAAGPPTDEIEKWKKNVTPHGYSSSIAQFTLPRHTNQHLWPNYNSALTEIRNMQPITSMQQHSLPTSSNTNKMLGHSEPINSNTTENAKTASNLSSTNIRPHDILQEKLQVQRAICVSVSNSDKRTMEPPCLCEEEIAAQAPLMMKRESTV